MGKIVIFFIIAPILDLYILINASKEMGFWTTVLLIVATSIAGYYLARSEGKIVIKNINSDLAQGIVPNEELLNGLCILLGGIFLIIPGIITDIIGITMVLPGTRDLYKSYFKKTFANKINRGANRFLKW